MERRRRTSWRNFVATIAVLGPVVAVVVWSSFQVSDYECEVCVVFDGREACRTVTAKTEEEGLRGATDNACAQLTSGVTNSLRCTNNRPTRAACRSLAGTAP